MSAGGEASSQPKAFPLRMAWALSRFLLRTGRSRLKMVSWSLSSSDSDIIRLELCSVLRCLIPAERKGVWVWASFKPAAISYTLCLVSWILLMWNSGDFVLTVSSRRPDQRCSLLGLFFNHPALCETEFLQDKQHVQVWVKVFLHDEGLKIVPIFFILTLSTVTCCGFFLVHLSQFRFYPKNSDYFSRRKKKISDFLFHRSPFICETGKTSDKRGNI